MEKLEKLIEKAQQSTLFTSPVLGNDLERFLENQSDKICNLANRVLEENYQHVFWSGSGNSWVNLYSGKYLMDKFTTVPNDVYISYDLVTRDPLFLNEKALAFLASFSGATEDTVAALRHAKKRNATTIAIVRKKDSLMGKESDEVIAYNSKALYILPLAASYLFSLELARLQGCSEVKEIIDGLYKLPSLLKKQYVEEKSRAYELAKEFSNEKLFYVLSSGPLYGIGYKFGLTVFMENMRINGSFMDATEFRHGPVEMLEREKPAIVILKGTDESRGLVERVEKLCETQNAHVLVYDLKNYPDIHPLLAPFALMIPLQWFSVYSAILRGITDLDERVLMGRGILGQGKGITWP